MCPNLTNNSEVTIVESCRYYWIFLFEPKEVTHRLRNLGLEEARPKEILNNKVIGNFINSLKRVTQNFNIGRMKRKGLKLKGFLRYDFELESIFKFLLVFRVCFLMQYECMMSCNMSALYVPHQKKRGAKYRWLTCRRWQSHIHPHSQF
jgi:hypothetical protein